MQDGPAERVVIIGHSIGGWSTAKSLRKLGYDGDVVVVEPEPAAPYRRPALSKGLLAAADVASIQLGGTGPPDWTIRSGCRVSRVDFEESRVELSDGTDDLEYNHLILATGSRPRPAPFVSSSFHHLRSLDDSLRLKAAMSTAARAVIVGAGFIGLELAASMRKAGIEVVLLEQGPKVLGGRVGDRLTKAIEDLHVSHGVEIRLGVTVVSVLADDQGRTNTVLLDDGAALDADLFVWSTGGSPNVDLLRGTAADITDGVLCDSSGRVRGLPGVWAVGDVARWEYPRYGAEVRIEHWTNASDHALVVARSIVDADDEAVLESIPFVWSDQYDRKYQSFGWSGQATSCSILRDDDSGVVEGQWMNDRLVAVSGLVTEGAALMKYRRLLNDGESL